MLDPIIYEPQRRVLCASFESIGATVHINCCHSKLHSGQPPWPALPLTPQSHMSMAVYPKAIPGLLQHLLPFLCGSSLPQVMHSKRTGSGHLQAPVVILAIPPVSYPIAESLCLHQDSKFLHEEYLFSQQFQFLSTTWFPSDSSTILNN